MNTSIEKQQGPVSNGNCYLSSKVAKDINQAINLLVESQRETFNVNPDNSINGVVTKETICQKDIETGFQGLSDNENRLLITVLNSHIKSLEKQLDEKQVLIETLLKNLRNFSYNNIAATSSYKFDQIFCENIGSPQGEKKEISSIDKSIQIHSDNSNKSGINNQEAIRESNKNQSEALDNSVDNSNGKEITEQPNGSLRHHPDHIDRVKSTGKEKKKTVAIIGDSIIRNIPSRSFNNSLNECFSIIKSFPGATTKSMRDYIKPSVARELDAIVLHTRTNDLKNNKTPSDIAGEIIQLAKEYKD